MPAVTVRACRVPADQEIANQVQVKEKTKVGDMESRPTN